MSGNPQKSNADPKTEDAFWLTDLYPDAKALLTHKHVSLSNLGDDYIVVLDANVLLLPFETTSASIEAIRKVYEELAVHGRLIVPGQVVREFYKNRSNKIGEIIDTITKTINRSKIQIFENSIPILEKNQNYKDSRDIARDIVNKGKEIQEKLSLINSELKDNIGEDPVSILYREYLAQCVCELEVKDGERTEIVKEFEKRKRFQIGPGHKDGKKEDGGIGDYLIWLTILQEAKKRQKHCIFVTEEAKTDWWVKKDAPVQPRPELISEYREASGGKSLYLLPLSALLKKFNAEREAVEQIQELEKAFSNIEEIDFNLLNENIRKNLSKDQHLKLLKKVNLENKAKRLSRGIQAILKRIPEENGKDFIIGHDGKTIPTREVLSDMMASLRNLIEESDKLSQSLDFSE